MEASTHSILIIDDETENLKALERTLSSVSKVHLAQCAKLGLEIIEKEPIVLAICDQRMPEMTGIEFFKIIAKTHPDIIRIILTGYTDVEDLIEAINEVGLYRYITKPWNNHDLQLMIKRALEHFEVSRRNQELVQELKRINEGLEKTVQERTKKLHSLNKQLNTLATMDDLTQVGNPRFLWHELTQEIERSKRYKHDFSFLLIDIDYFKQYNDEFGHAIGDKTLKRVVQILKKNIRVTDKLARYGGEEFAIILPETSCREAQDLAERLRSAVTQKPFSFKLKTTKAKKGLTISIGVTTSFAKSHKTAKTLVKKADQALYQAKQKGRNCVVCL